MNVLVTGGGGFIGSALARELIKNNFTVTSFSRGDYPELRKAGIRIIRGDITDLEQVIKAEDNIEVVFHVAAKAGISGSYNEYYAVNVTGTGNILQACRLRGIKYLIYTSSASVVFDGKDICGADESLPYPLKPVSHYTATKAIAEQMVLHANSPDMRTIALRPHLVYGPGDIHLLPRILLAAKTGRLMRIGKGRNLIDVSYIDNVVAAHLKALLAIQSNTEAAGKAYFITNGEPVVLWDFMNELLISSGYNTVNKSVPETIAFLIAGLMESFHNLFRGSAEPLLTRFLVRELSRSHWFNISRARNSLNYNPEISNKGGLEKMSAYV